MPIFLYINIFLFIFFTIYELILDKIVVDDFRRDHPEAVFRKSTIWEHIHSWMFFIFINFLPFINLAIFIVLLISERDCKTETYKKLCLKANIPVEEYPY